MVDKFLQKNKNSNYWTRKVCSEVNPNLIVVTIILISGVTTHHYTHNFKVQYKESNYLQ